MKRVIFVDDEPFILEGLRNLLRHRRREWDMVFVESGKAALKEMSTGSFDIIISDMRMPEMDGAALLERVQKEYPRTVRIALSGHAEVETASRAVWFAHQFLSKPCKPGEIEDVIERTCGLQSLIHDKRLQDTVGHIDQLPPAPHMYTALTDVLTKPGAGVSDVASVLRKDMAMCAKLLQLVNSSFFAARMPIVDIEFAIARLGFPMVKNLVMSLDMFRSLVPRTPGFSIENAQQHALRVAVCAQRILPQKDQTEEAFMAGLLHDIGILVMACELPERLVTATQEATTTGEPLHVVEERLYGVTHAEVGGFLLGVWGLPHSVVEAVANHHTPMRVHSSTFDVLGATHIASALTSEALANTNPSRRELPVPIDDEYVSSRSLDERLESFRAIAMECAAASQDNCPPTPR